MALETYSKFNYGHTVTENNNYINFDEGIGELSAEIDVGSYSLGDFVSAVASAMNDVGTQEYDVTLDRATNRITITSISAFDLLIASGTQVNISAFSLMGFNGADLTGAITYESDSASGFSYEPQFILQNYVDFEDDVAAANSTLNQSASGRVVEVVKYGNVKLMSCDIKYITDITPQGVIKENATGVSDARQFMSYCITKGNLEVVPDIDAPGTFTKCLLESTPESRDGTGFVLKELYSRGLTGYFELNRLKFRKIEG